MALQSSQRATNTVLIGIGLMLASVVVFSTNNAFGKWMVGTFPVGQFMLMRGCVALLMLAPFYWRAGAILIRDAPHKKLQVARIVLSSIEITAFYVAVVYLPLADAMTFWLATPIYVTALSAVFLGEKVGWRRWTAVMVGFFGVMLAMRPSGTTFFTWPSLVGLMGGVLYAWVLLATRALRETPSIVLIGGSLVGSTVVGLIAVIVLPFSWVAPRPVDFLLLAIMAAFFIGGALCSNRSLRLAPASVVVPFQYMQIIFGVLLGYFVFGEVPDPLMLIGAAIITGAGIYIFLREQRVAKRDPLPIEPT